MCRFNGQFRRPAVQSIRAFIASVAAAAAAGAIDVQTESNRREWFATLRDVAR